MTDNFFCELNYLFGTSYKIFLTLLMLKKERKEKRKKPKTEILLSNHQVGPSEN